jgi:hypothetical protein
MDRQDITEILLKVTLNTINHQPPTIYDAKMAINRRKQQVIINYEKKL